MAEYLDFTDVDDITDVTAVKEHGGNAETTKLRAAYNKLAQIVSLMMPGVLLSAPALKAGTTDATTVRTEAFTMKARGLVLSVSAAETAFTATGHDTAATKESWYTVCVATDGSTITIVKGADQTIGTKVLAIGGDNTVIVGYIQMITGSGGFDATTDDLTADGTKIATLRFYDAPYVETVNAA